MLNFHGCTSLRLSAIDLVGFDSAFVLNPLIKNNMREYSFRYSKDF